MQVLTTAGGADSGNIDVSDAAAEDAVSAPASITVTQLSVVPSARRSVAELQRVLLANPVAGPPLGKVGQLSPWCHCICTESLFSIFITGQGLLTARSSLM